MFYNAYEFLMNSGQCTGVDVIVKAYRLYLEQCPPAPGEEPLLALTRAWTLVRFVESGMLQRSVCSCCSGSFVTYAHIPENSFTCSLCQPRRAFAADGLTVKFRYEPVVIHPRGNRV